MAKAKQAAKGTGAAAAPKATATRGRMYGENDTIVIATGDEARRVVKGLAPERAIAAMAAHPRMGDYLATFGAACDKVPLPGRGGQPGRTQAAGICRWLEKQGALHVKPAK